MQGSGSVDMKASIFGRFAGKWLSAMVDVLVGTEADPRKDGIHYLLLDACVTFLGWPALFPVPPGGDAPANLMNYLV